MEGISDRVLKVITPKMGKRGKAAFARKIGVTPQTLEHYLKNRGVPGAEVLSKIARECNVSLRWLTTGERDPVEDVRAHHTEKNAQQADIAQEVYDALSKIPGLREKLVRPSGHPLVANIIDITRQVSEKLRATHPEDFVSIPLLADAAAAGPAAVVDERDVEDYVVMYRDWVPHPAQTKCLRVKGDSMHPVLPSGSLVAVDATMREPRDLNGAIVAALVDDAVVVKWLRATERGVVLVSENREFEPIVIDGGEHVSNPVIGKVIWSLAKWLTPDDLAR